MLGVERQHDFHIIRVSAIYLHFDLKITSQNALQDAPVALKTSLGALLGALRPFWNAQGPPGGTPAPVWDQFSKDLAWIWRFVRQRKKGIHNEP